MGCPTRKEATMKIYLKVLTMTTLITLCLVCLPAMAAQRPPIAVHLGDALVQPPPEYVRVYRASGSRELGIAGACDRIVDTMCIAECGGMGIPWPVPPCPDPSSVNGNTFSPCGMALLYGYTSTGDPAHLNGAMEFGEFGLCYAYSNGEYKLATGTPFFMWFITDNIPIATQYAEHVETYYFQPLENGTYGPDDYSTESYLQEIALQRSGDFINLRTFEMTDLLKASYLMGTPDQFNQMACWDMQDAIDMLDETKYYDISGAACGVFSLTFAGLDYDPQAGPWVSQSSMFEVMVELLQYQHPDGGFVWSSQLTPPYADIDQNMQDTVYATMAMKALDPWYFADEIAAAEAWILSMQLPNGGFQPYLGASEYIQVDGEALWGLMFQPEPWNDGDVDNNHMHTPQDAQQAFMIYLGSLIPGYHQFNSADCSADGTVTPGDAQCIFESALGMACTCEDPIIQPPQCTKHTVKAEPVQVLQSGRMIADIQRNENTATVAIRADAITADVDCLGFTVRIPESWTLTQKTFSGGLETWHRCGAEQHGTSVKVGAWTLGETLTDGSRITLTFDTGTGMTTQTVGITNLLDDIAGFDVVVN